MVRPKPIANVFYKEAFPKQSKPVSGQLTLSGESTEYGNSISPKPLESTKKQKLSVQVTLKQPILSKLEKMAMNYGIPKSTAVSIIVNQYFEALDNLGTLKDLLQKANEEIEKATKP